MVSRRSAIRRLAGLVGGVGLAGCNSLPGRNRNEDRFGLGSNPRDLPDRQHAWNDTLRTDGHGNHLAPSYHRILLLTAEDDPTVESARTVERAMRDLEVAFDWAPDGLLHVLAWGPDHFERLDALKQSPARRPQVISRTDDPELQSHDAALVLASDRQSPLAAAEAALFGDRTDLGGVEIADLGGVFSIVGRRTGFIGQGLPAEHTDAEGIPDAAPLSSSDPMFMGFFSGMQKTQASEDRVTIDGGQFDGGTTMHLSHLRTSLSKWFDGMDEADRVARMFSPSMSPSDVDGMTIGEGLGSLGEDLPAKVAEHGVAGHLEKLTRARRDGEPLLLRRDFNTVDGGHTGVHFLSLQESLEDFVSTRDAMNGWWLRDDHPAVTDRENNGILDFLSVVSRANFYVPPRAQRSFPLLRA